MMPKLLFIVITLLFFIQDSASQQNNIWYFGRKAGLNFNLGAPRPLHNSAMDADEGSASICDKTGNLLFYTNGVTVYNRNHQVMLNGTGLKGNLSTVQSSLIVPMPGTDNIYYIFTTDAVENNFANGYNYSVVDLNRDNGKGEVISKNVLFNASCTERLTAARHADGVSVWIITNDNNSNIFRAWLMDCNGLSNNPVVSTVGAVLNTHGLMNTGMMKLSPDGKQLCQTHFPFLDDGIVSPNFFQLFDFDNLTGVLSNSKMITPGDAAITACEYSPNSQLLYLSRAYDKKVDQVEPRLGSAIAIANSRFTFNTSNASFFGIQLAPDQKIYLAHPHIFLGVINNPNVKGAGCNLQTQQLDINELISGSAYAGLPNFINDMSFDGSHGFTYTILDSCMGRIQFNGLSTMQGSISWNWDFGDGNTSSLQNPVHSFSSASEMYQVKLKIQTATGCGAIERAKNVIPKGLILDASFNFKAICDSGIVRFTNTSTFLPDSARIQYLWDFGDGNTSMLKDPVHTYATGIYPVRLTIQTTTACLDRWVDKIVTMEVLNIQAPADVEINSGETVQLTTMGGGTSFSWSPPAGLSNPRVSNPVAKPKRSTVYVITATNNAGCKDSDSIFIKVKPVPGIHVPSGFTPNNDGKNDFLRPSIDDNYTLEEFSIFNRWGQRIYTTKQKETGWNAKVDGVQQDAGVYIWHIRVMNITTGKKEIYKGSFVLIR